MHSLIRTFHRTLAAPLAAALLLAAAPSGAATPAAAALPGTGLPPGIVLEGSVETTTDAVIFPGDASGRLSVRGCNGCAHSTIQVDGNTQYLLAGESLGLREFAQYALRNPGRSLTIHYRLKDTVATRVTVLVR